MDESAIARLCREALENQARYAGANGTPHGQAARKSSHGADGSQSSPRKRRRALTKGFIKIFKPLKFHTGRMG